MKAFTLVDLLVSIAMLGLIGVIVLGVYKGNEGNEAMSKFEIVNTVEKMGYSRVVVRACLSPATISGCEEGNLYACSIRAKNSQGVLVHLIACTPRKSSGKTISFFVR